MPRFSIITPTYNRADGQSGGRLKRCLRSTLMQEYQDFEHILVDDGSTDETQARMRLGAISHSAVRYIRIDHSDRVIARNSGMQESCSQWLLWLDSDDALDPMYLKTVDYHIRQNPEARLFVCGAVVHGMVKEEGRYEAVKWTKLRPAWVPPFVDRNATNFRIAPKWVHGYFPSGKVGTGMFIFHREALEKVGPMPDWRSHLEVADGIDEWLGYETGYSAAKKWVGNPWGEDHAYFSKLSHFYQVHPIPAALYVQYVR